MKRFHPMSLRRGIVREDDPGNWRSSARGATMSGLACSACGLGAPPARVVPRLAPPLRMVRPAVTQALAIAEAERAADEAYLDLLNSRCPSGIWGGQMGGEQVCIADTPANRKSACVLFQTLKRGRSQQEAYARCVWSGLGGDLAGAPLGTAGAITLVAAGLVAWWMVGTKDLKEKQEGGR